MSTELQDELFTVQPRPRPALAGESLFRAWSRRVFSVWGRTITDDGQVRGRDRCEGKVAWNISKEREVESPMSALISPYRGSSPRENPTSGVPTRARRRHCAGCSRRLHVVPDGCDDEGRSIGSLLRHHKILPSPRAAGVASDSQGFHYSTIHGC